jgi:ubiquinone/menaquinone biosynthesis C-methylase UbiE
MAETGYQLQGSAPQQYERANVPRILIPHTKRVFEHVTLQAGDRVLDAACGTGVVTRVAVEQFNHLASIVGIDINPGMLEVARTHTPSTDIPIEWREGDVCALPFPNDSFEVVLCQQSLQFIPDKLRALQEMRRVLVPSGRLVFTAWSEPFPLNAALAGALKRHVNAETATSCLAPFAWGALGRDPIRELVHDAGFRDIEMEVIVSTICMPAAADAVIEQMKFVGSRSPFVGEIEAAIGVLEREVSAALQTYREGDDFVMPATSHLVQARVN